MKRFALLGLATTAAALCSAAVAAAGSGGSVYTATAGLFQSNPFCSVPAGEPASGTVVLHVDPSRNDTRIHITLLNGAPDSVYAMSAFPTSVSCFLLANAPTLTTNHQGDGAGEFDFPGVPSPGLYTVALTTLTDYRVALFYIGG